MHAASNHSTTDRRVYSSQIYEIYRPATVLPTCRMANQVQDALIAECNYQTGQYINSYQY